MFSCLPDSNNSVWTYIVDLLPAPPQMRSVPWVKLQTTLGQEKQFTAAEYIFSV